MDERTEREKEYADAIFECNFKKEKHIHKEKK